MNASNIADVISFLDGFVDSFNFTRPGNDQSLGRDIANKVVERIYDRSLDQRAGPGGPWDKNEPKYAKWKDKNYGVAEPNSRTGQMLSHQSLFGRTKIDPEQVTMIYGLDEPPVRATFGTPTEKQFEQDRKVTDVQKAYFAHTGQSKHRIKRPFYAVDESDGRAVVELCQENLNRLIVETNAGNGY